MTFEKAYQPLYGDLHNHCGVSYGHGRLEDALDNAALRLDFVSITGHAAWPDMDIKNPDIAHIVDFHIKGFAKLREGWDTYIETIAVFENATGMIVFPGYEIHSNTHGDYTIVGREHPQELRIETSPEALTGALGADAFIDNLPASLMFPHHIGYRPGARGINWDSFVERLSPVVEIDSMHGLAEDDDGDHPFLHSMGPLQHLGTMNEGLRRGHRFGVIGNTDHHSGHPGSFGHGLAGVWAVDKGRKSIWEAIYARRTWAMTGDKVGLWFTVNKRPMGSFVSLDKSDKRTVEIDVDASSPIDYVELRADGGRRHVFWRPSIHGRHEDEAIIFLEFGWGERGKPYRWEGSFGVAGSSVKDVYPRFRGPEIVSPLDAKGEPIPTRHARWDRVVPERVNFEAFSWGNMTNTTPSTQGIALRVVRSAGAIVKMKLSGKDIDVPLETLLKGSVSGNLGAIDSPAYRLSASTGEECHWIIVHEDPEPVPKGWYHARVRLKNGHWAISSPVFIGND